MDDSTLHADGFDAALIGYAQVWDVDGHIRQKAVYNSDQCIQILIDRDGMTPEEAVEYFEYNVTGSYVGPYTPIFVYESSSTSID